MGFIIVQLQTSRLSGSEEKNTVELSKNSNEEMHAKPFAVPVLVTSWGTLAITVVVVVDLVSIPLLASPPHSS